MTVLITGVAGFIGFHVARQLLDQGHSVMGIDTLNDYYDQNLKEARLLILKKHPEFHFRQLDISQENTVATFFKDHSDIHYIVHLAAQAGVRYSLTHPFAYVDANMRGHLAILEGMRFLPNLKHMVYASSSSVYGANTKRPFSIEDRTDHPVSLYAASKKSCELMSECYSHLYKMPLKGLRFFTVYGPWGRPDMAAFIFTKAILEGKEMPVFNQGRMRRNFTHIDDIVSGVIACLYQTLDNQPPHKVYNIGNNKSESLMDFIHILEKHIGKRALIRFEPLQQGDVVETIADIEASTQDFGFTPRTNIDEGLKEFIDWYRHYYDI